MSCFVEPSFRCKVEDALYTMQLQAAQMQHLSRSLDQQCRLQGKMPQGQADEAPADDRKKRTDTGERQQNGAGPSGQADWVARGSSGRGSKHHGVDPVVPFTDAAQLQAVREFYGIGPEVSLERHLVTRSTSDVDKPKRLYFIGPGEFWTCPAAAPKFTLSVPY